MNGQSKDTGNIEEQTLRQAKQNIQLVKLKKMNNVHLDKFI